jgi:RNA polymerase sigma-70 factor (ECF subfamily)
LPEFDNHIIEALRRGEVRRFGELVDRHKDRAMTLALRLVSDRQEAEELVQDAFVRVYRSLDTFRGDAAFSTWFYRILYNVCMTRAVRRPLRDILTDSMEEGGPGAEMMQDADPSILDQIEDRETIAMLHEELGRIPLQYRVALTLFYVQEMSHEEMASVLQMPIGTIKTNLSRGRNALRQRVLQRMKSEEYVR